MLDRDVMKEVKRKPPQESDYAKARAKRNKQNVLCSPGKQDMVRSKSERNVHNR